MLSRSRCAQHLAANIGHQACASAKAGHGRRSEKGMSASSASDIIGGMAENGVALISA